MEGLEPGWGISVLGETPALLAWGLESPEHVAGNELMRERWDQPFILCTGHQHLEQAVVQQFTSAEHESGPQHQYRVDRSTRLNQDQPRLAARTITPKLGPKSLWEVSHWVTQGVLPAFQENTRDMIVLNYVTGLRAEHPNILPIEGHNLVMVLFAHYKGG